MNIHKPHLVREGTIVDDMLRVLSDEIVAGLWPPGTKLDAQFLAERFQVSRTPVREMFGHLAAMGLVERRPNRGVTVATISDDALAHMFEAMAELEAACARLCALRMTRAERQALEQAHEGSIALVRDGTTDEYEAFNHEFHSLLYEGCHSPYLRDLAFTTRSRIQPFRRAQFHVTSRPSHSWEEHVSIVSAIRAGDAEGAARATRSHVMKVSLSSQTFVDEHRSRASMTELASSVTTLPLCSTSRK